MSKRHVQATKNYKLFKKVSDNRPLDLAKHRKLRESMQTYGFLRCFPLACFRDEAGDLIVKDGQHRLAFAEMLGLPVWWIEDDVDFDVAMVNSTARTWLPLDYARRYAELGNDAYCEAIEFSKQHNIPILTSCCLLMGTASTGNIRTAFMSGALEVRDREWADAVAGIYAPLCRMCPKIRNARFIEACMAVCRVKEFDWRRLVSNAERCREKLAPYSTRDAYLDMLETIYNYGRVKLVGLKAAAIMAMRERNPALSCKADQ